MLLLVLGCGPGGVSGVTDPLIVQAAFLGLVEPESKDIDLSDTDFDEGSAITALLADAKSLADVENAGVGGAEAQVRVGDTPVVELSPTEDEGQYSATGSDGLVYSAGDEVLLTLVVDEVRSTVWMELPEASGVSVPETGVYGEDLPIDMSETDFTQVLATVINTKSGRVTWSNEPQGLKEWHEFTEVEGAASFLIPAEAFTEPNAVFAVGIAGIEMASEEDLVEMNTALSGMQAGLLEFSPYLPLEE